MTILKPSHIDKLFSNLSIGDQAIFEHNLELWKQNLLFSNKTFSFESNKTKNVKEVATKAKTTPVLEENLETKTTAIIVPQVSVAPSIPQASIARKSVEQPKPTPSHSLPTTSSSTTLKSACHLMPSLAKQAAMGLVPMRYSLRTILEETSGGQMIMNYYEKHKILREEHRTALINVIGRYIDANGGGLTLSESGQLEAQIVDLFPTEKAEFYRTNRRGRIYNKVANMKRVYKKFIMPPEEHSVVGSMDNSMTSAPSSPSELIS